MEIKYVKMPISKEEKAKYHRQGFRVIDERFKPEGHVDPEVEGDADEANPNTQDDDQTGENKPRRNRRTGP